jgi:serine/threonine-protein kinase
MAEQLRNTIIAGKYRLLSVLGRGEMGEVYRAEQLDVEGQVLREVALKMIQPKHVSDPNFARRFLREVRVATRLRSPHTVTVYDAGQGEDGQLFFSMELSEGPTLRELLNESVSLPVERAVLIVQQICLALSEAHGLPEPIIHRDLKPANIFVEQQYGRDWVKVGDFGIAKVLSEHTSGLTQTGMSPVTPRHMAPEQWKGGALDGRTDLYAVGILLYEMLLGQPPFRVDGGPTSLMYKHLEEVPAALPAMVPGKGANVLLLQLLEFGPQGIRANPVPAVGFH